jgi:hypothetical protein
VVAPAGGPSGDGNHEQAGGTKLREGCVSLGQQAAVRGERVVDVGEHAADRAAGLARELGERPHRARAHPPR